MLMIPIKRNDDQQDILILVLDKDNVERMKHADPVTITSLVKPLVNPAIMICYEEPSPEFNKLVQSGNIQKLIKFLNRGFEFRPDMGDHDRGPESLTQSN